MQGQAVAKVTVDLGSLVKALYHHLPVTPENTKAVRAIAWAALANVLISDYLNHWNEATEGGKGAADLLSEAKKAAKSALDLNDKLALAHYAQGLVHRAENQRENALKEFGLAIDNDPGFARAWAQRGSEKINHGRFDDALKDLKRAIEIGRDDPSAGMFHWNRGRAFFLKEVPDYPKAIEALTEAVRLRPNLWHNWLYLVSAYALNNKLPEAQAWLNKFKTESPFKDIPFTIDKIIEYEKANPTENSEVKKGRDRFHDGLEAAGMKRN
jgi:tetratricopeptide (TPR) repeat protein